jgi:hypothetical protein
MLMLLFALPGFSQEISVEASVNKNPVMPGEQVNVTVTIYNSQGNVEMPQLNGMTFLFGPSVSQSTTNVNGKRSSSIAYSYAFRADKEGTVNIPAITVRTSAGAMRTKPIDLKVTRSSSGGSGRSVGGDFAVTIEPSKRKLYLGEALVLEYKIYQVYGNFRASDYTFPDIPGFWPERVENHQAVWESVLVNGQRYQVATIKVDVLYPQKTGKHTLEGFTMSGTVGSFFNQRRVSAESKPVTIDVLPLPASKPDNFIGTFSAMEVEVQPSTTHAKSNEAINLSITYSGRGNLRLIPEPKINWPPDIEVYDPEVKDRITVTPSGMTGKRTFEYLIIPRNAGNYTITIPSTHWFSPKSAEYKSKKPETLLLEIERGEGTADLNYAFNSKSDVQVLNKDIRFIRSQPGILVPNTTFFFRSMGYYLFAAMPLLLFLTAALFRKKQLNEAANVEQSRKRKAGRYAKKWLQEAERSMADAARFYEALSRGLEQFASDKFGIDRSALNTATLKATIREQAGEEQADAYVKVYEECAMGRYAPSAAMAPKALLNEARNVIKSLEDLT